VVGPRYHELFGIELAAGRGFEDRDRDGAEPVVIINQTAAARYFAGRDPVGGVVTMGDLTATIIGVARDAKYHSLTEEPRPYLYLPMLQHRRGFGAAPRVLVVRTAGDARPMLPALVAAVQAADPVVPVANAATMTERLRDILAPQLAGAWLLGAFSILALVVAAVGVYGIVAYSVSRRTQEIGIRIALGAPRGSVVGLVVSQSLGFVAVGVPIGIGLALLLARGMTAFLYGVSANDVSTLVATSALMVAIGLVASLLPARKATRVDPLLAVRADT
jgi:hypothetical protein